MRSIFPNQNVQNTPFSDHFYKLKYRKNAHRGNVKYISKLNYIKHTRFGPLLEVKMSKKYISLWCKIYLEIKMYKISHVRATKGRNIEKVHVIVAQSTFRNQNIKTTQIQTIFRNLNIASLQISLHYNTLHYTTLHYITIHYTPLHSTTFHYTTLPSTTLHYITLHYLPLHFTTLHYNPSVDSLCHPGFTTTNFSYRFPIFETSATSLCGTTGVLHQFRL